MLRATLSGLRAHKLRLILSGLAVVLGVMFVSGAFVLTDTLGRSFDSLFSTVYSQTDVEVSAPPRVAMDEFEGEQVAATLPAGLVEQVQTVPGVAAATGLVVADGARVVGTDGKVVSTLGAPRFGANWTGEDPLVQLREGRGPERDDEIAVNASLAEAAGIEPGDRVEVLTLEPKRTFTLVGIFGYAGGRDSIGGTYFVAFTTPAAQELMLGETDAYTTIDVQAAPGVSPDELRDRLQATLGDSYVVKTGEQLAAETADSFRGALDVFNNILLGFAAVALFVGVFLILNTFSIIIAQRMRELALLRAVGASRRQMIGSVLLEALVIGLVASVFGIGAGVGVGALLAYVFGQFGGGLELAGIGVPPEAYIAGFTVGILVTLIAAILPALRAARIPPVAALQEAATPDRPLTRITTAGAVVLAAGGGLLAAGLAGWIPDDLTLWGILAGVLVSFIGVALLTPLISRPVVAVLGRLFSWSVPGKLGRLNSGRNPRRTAITAAALMVGVALVTGVGVVASSAKVSFTALAEDTVRADLIIGGEQTGPRPPTFDPAVLEPIAALPEVQTAAGQYGDIALVDGERGYVSAANNLAALSEVYGLSATEGTLRTLGPGEMVADDATAREQGLAVGDRVTVQLSRGEPRSYELVGVYGDTELFGGIVLPAAATADFGIPQPTMGLIQLRPGTDADAVLPRVEALLADSPEVSVTDRTSFIEQQTAEVDTLLIMIQILLALAILIAVLGIINTLALSVLERTRELGLLRAVGLGRAQTMRMVTVESVVISVFGALLGVAVGTGLGTAVVQALREEGISQLAVPWTQMTAYLLLAGLVGVVAAVVPAIRAARINVLNAIAYE